MLPPNDGPGFLSAALEELQPFPGRMSASLRMALSCVIVVVLSMSQQVPEAALSCYLIFFASRNDAATGILIALGLVLAASVGIALGVIVLQLAADQPTVRLALMAAFTFGGMYLSVATPAGEIGATTGFVFAFALSLADFVPLPELLAHGLSWMWVVVFFPMATLVLVNGFLGRNPVGLARAAIADRLAAAAALLRGESHAHRRASKLLAEKPDDLTMPPRLGVLLGFASRAEAERLASAIPEAQKILAGSLMAGADPPLASDLDRLATMVRTRAALPDVWRPECRTVETLPLAQASGRLLYGLAGNGPPPASAPLKLALPADAFTNPEYRRFALKTLLAVFITYTIYTARGAFDIHTAMITCFYVALGTAGETLHKATLRIVGCLIGAAMGLASIIFLMPHMTDIGQLMLLVAACSFVAGWVANGSELIRYAGWQMALAFFLCVLHGYGPSFDLDVATNRIMGILVGNVVVAIVFLGLWPTSVARRIDEHVSRSLRHLVSALGRAPEGVAEAASEIEEARALARLSVFEPRWLRSRTPTVSPFSGIVAMSETALGEVARLQMLGESRSYLARAPYRVRSALRAEERYFTMFLTDAAAAILQPRREAPQALRSKLRHAFRALERLERLARKAPKRAPWESDLVGAARSYRRLLLGFDQILEAM